MKIKDLKNMIKEELGDNPILLAKPEILFEANYGRVKRKIENQMIPFAMLSAFRGGLSSRENLERQNQLEEYVSQSKFPFTKMPGSGYVEDPEPAEEEELVVDPGELTENIGFEEEPEETEIEEPQPEGVEVKENSILIWDQVRPDQGERTAEDLTLFELAKFLAKKYDQDSFIYGEPVSGATTGKHMEILPYDKNGVELDWGVKWSSLAQVSDDDLYWSTIGSKKAKLVEYLNRYQKMPVKSRLDAMKKQYYLNAIKFALKRIEDE